MSSNKSKNMDLDDNVTIIINPESLIKRDFSVHRGMVKNMTNHLAKARVASSNLVSRFAKAPVISNDYRGF